MARTALQLYDPRNGDLSLKIERLEDLAHLDRPQRTNYFSVLWPQQGSGTFFVDTGAHPFGPRSLLFLVPYQSFRVIAESPLRGDALHFHANFFCMEAHHEEVGCNGVLFNDVYGVPVLRLESRRQDEFADLVAQMRRELSRGELAHPEVLVSYLKIFLVKATRLKLQQQAIESPATPARKPPAVLAELKQLIEANFRTLHSPADYAGRLHLAPKSLAKLVKTHLHKTVTCLIRERLVRQAKWDLLHTPKPVKQIAAELGFEDVFYFSRLFKRATGLAPTDFRDFEAEIRGPGRNLSIP